MYTNIKLKSLIVLIVFNSIILNTHIKINDINGKTGAFCATFKWANLSNLRVKSIIEINNFISEKRTYFIFNSVLNDNIRKKYGKIT